MLLAAPDSHPALFLFLGPILRPKKPSDPPASGEKRTRLHRKKCGDIAELIVMHKAISQGLAVAKPWGDCDAFDLILIWERCFWRVQVKSIWTPPSARAQIRTCHGGPPGTPYSRADIDFVVAYVAHAGLCYIFPVAFLRNRTAVVFYLNDPAYDSYCEAWELFRQRSPQSETSPAQVE